MQLNTKNKGVYKMDLNIIIDLLHTSALLALTYTFIKQKRVNTVLADRINICAKNPVKARKQKPLKL